MGKITSEKQLLKKLKVKSIDSLSKEKISEFISVLPNVDSETAKKIISQFPDFTKFATQAIQEFSYILDKAKEGTKGSDAYFRSCEIMIESLQKKLDSDNLSEEEINHIIDKMMQIAQKIAEQDEKDKAFILKILKGFFNFVMAFAIMALTILGIKNINILKK